MQGVGFRYDSCRIARSHGIRGYVRNLSDGDVELVGEAAPGALRRMVDEICQETHGHVVDYSVSTSAATDQFSSFNVSF